MTFENDYNLFVDALMTSDAKKAEDIISQCDNKKVFIRRAIDDIGGEKVELVSLLFRGNGLKRQIENVINEYY